MKIITNKVNSIDELCFDVEETKVAFGDSGLDKESRYKLTNDYKARVRSDNKKLIAVVPSTTELISNNEVIRTATNIIDQVGYEYHIDKTQSYYSDKKMRLTLEFPELHILDDTPEGQVVNLNLYNSYDTSNAVKAFFGSIRYICTNGAIIGTLLGKFYHKHTRGFNNIEFRIALEEMYKKITNVNERFGILASLDITDDLINETEKKLGKKVNQFVKTNIEIPSIASENKPVKNQLQLLNLLTYYVSHNLDRHRREVYQYHISKMFGL